MPEGQPANLAGARAQLLACLDHMVFSIAMLGLVVVAVVADVSKVAGYAIIGVFAAEALARAWAMGAVLYFRDPFCVIDLTLLLIDFACVLVGSVTRVEAGRFARLARVMKVVKFVRLARGLRCFRNTYRSVMGIQAHNRPMARPGGFTRWVGLMDSNGDGAFHLNELLVSMRAARISVSPTMLESIFNEVYAQNAGLLALFDDAIHAAAFSQEEKTITAAELENYICKLRPSTYDERVQAIAYGCTVTFRFWAIFGNLVAKIIMLFGLDYWGPLQAWQWDNWVNNEGFGAVVVFRTLNLVGGFGFLSLLFRAKAQEFDAVESAERALCETFNKNGKLRRIYGYDRDGDGTMDAFDTDGDGCIDATDTTGDGNIDSKDTNGDGLFDAHTTSDGCVDIITGPSKASVGDQVAFVNLTFESMQALLDQNKIKISETAMRRLFNRVDTSGNGLISSRELSTYIDSWQPAPPDMRLASVAGAMFTRTGLCLAVMQVGLLILFGKDLLWRGLMSANDDATMVRFGLISLIAGIIGLIGLMFDATASEFDRLVASKQIVLLLADDDDPTQIGLENMFLVRSEVDSAAWVKRTLGADNLIPEDKLDAWTRPLREHPTSCHIKYFAARLRHAPETVKKATGMPTGVLYRLRDALDHNSESPWQEAALSLQDFQRLLEDNHVFMSKADSSAIFNEIDCDGTGKIKKPEMARWVKNYRPLTGAQKRTRVLGILVRSVGFWNLCLALFGVLIIMIPIEEPGAYALTTGIQIGRTCLFVGAAENMRQAWRTQAFGFDQYEHGKLSLKASIESAVDQLHEEDAQATVEHKAKAKAKWEEAEDL